MQMSWKEFALRLAGFVVIALAAMPVYALTVNVLLYFSWIPDDLVQSGFGNDMTLKAVMVGLGCLLPSFAAIFIRASWALILYLAPLYGPPLFAIAYTLASA